MGFYLDRSPAGQELPIKGKADAILKLFPGSAETKPSRWHPELVCVVDNGSFDAAGWCFDLSEFQDFKEPDGRQKRWLLVPGVKELFPYFKPYKSEED